MAYQNTAFVFLTGINSDRKFRVKELGLRCLVIRVTAPDVGIVVGIATDRPDQSTGYSSDLVYIDIPDWTDELDAQVQGIQKELGYYENAVRKRDSD
ncbi:hypothetical protein [Thiomicrorhabdus sp.]|uniref:hypothetical protein n=1 Tax=Thiomicrorhabdus sp. TaxID=2039724 RepID=UPI0035678EED